MEYIFITILKLAETFKKMNRSNPTVTFLDGLFIGKYERWGRAILTQSSFKSSICAIKIDIFISSETMRFSAT